MPVRTYDAKEVVVTVNGRLITGFSDGDKVSVEREGDLWAKKTGVDGETVRSRLHSSQGGVITIRLMYGSEANAELQSIRDNDLASGQGTVPISVRDVKGGFTADTDAAWLKTDVSPAFGAEAGENEWPYDCAKLATKVGVLTSS